MWLYKAPESLVLRASDLITLPPEHVLFDVLHTLFFNISHHQFFAKAEWEDLVMQSAQKVELDIIVLGRLR